MPKMIMPMDNGNVNMGLDNKYGDDDKNSALNLDTRIWH